MKKLRLFLRLFKESVFFAIEALFLNKLRTFLSILGITIGIFSIILVLTITDSLKANVKDSFKSLGQNTIYIQKWPWAFDAEYPWWKYVNRPQSNYREMEDLAQRLENNSSIAQVAFMMNFGGKTVKSQGNSMSNIGGAAVSHNYSLINTLDILEGRYFSENESRSGMPVAIIGNSIAMGLFGTEQAAGKRITMWGRHLTVIGVLKKEGQSILGNSMDENVIIPVDFLRNVMSFTNSEEGNPTILVKSADGVTSDDAEDEIKGNMRSIRQLKPTEDDNFALNKITMLSQAIDSVFGVLNTAGWFIGIFAVIVGGFGIANIMFVSVKERTNIIGIQKSLGARSIFILFQFLTEAIVLCLLGGLLGIGLVYLVAMLASSFSEFKIFLSASNFLLGNIISIVIGLLAGFIPAWSAARLDPVEAIRSKI